MITAAPSGVAVRVMDVIAVRMVVAVRVALSPA
jgi:hypothetical protein